MKYNYFRNCRVVINAGTVKIDDMRAHTRDTPVQGMAGVNIQRTYEDYHASGAYCYVRPRFIILKS